MAKHLIEGDGIDKIVGLQGEITRLDGRIDSAGSGGGENKQDKLVSGTNIKTVNGSSILGSGNITVVADVSNKVDKVAGKSLIADTEITRLASVVNQTKVSLGLSNVDNTSDVNKPVSTATAAAISGKVDKESGKSLVLDTEIAKLATYATEQYVTNAIAAIPPSESGAFQGTITLASVPTADGLYIPTEAGTYANAGGLIYAPSTTDANKLIQFSKKGAVWTKISIPVTTAIDNKVTATGGNSVKSSGIYDQIKSETKSIANKDLGLIVGNDSTMNGANSWVVNLGNPSFDVNSSIPNKMQITFTAGVNQNVQLNDVFKDIPNGTDFDISFKAKLVSGTSSALTIGAFTSSGTSILKATPTSIETVFNGSIKSTAALVHLSIGMLSTDNNGCVISIDDVVVRYKGYKTQESRISTLENDKYYNEQLELEIKDVLKVGTSVVRGNDSTMKGSNAWVSAQGGTNFNVNTTSVGAMYLDMPTTTNGAVKLPNSLIIDKTYIIKISLKKTLGNGQFYVGAYASSGFGTKTAVIQPTNDLKSFTVEITASSVDLHLFTLGATTDDIESRYKLEVDNITVYDKSLYPFVNPPVLPLFDANVDNLNVFNCDVVWGNLSKRLKPLTKICVIGDSLNANPVGGAIPGIEPANERPMRLGTENTISRRIYDYLSWNKPTHRKLAHADWTKSSVFTEITSGVFDPSASETLFENSTANSYIEIAIPNGQENFAIMLKEDLDTATVDVTLNGASISPYGLSVINTVNSAVGAMGNPFKTIEYLGLPSGVNTIRFTKRADTKKFVVWGGFYWSGNTMVVHNISHGGHSMFVLHASRLQGEFTPNKFDAVYFQLTEMNEQSYVYSTETSISWMRKIFDDYIKDIPVLVSSTPPLGQAGSSVNYYNTLATPQTHKQMNSALKKENFIQKRPFLDIFKMFERKVISRGGTLENGDAGVYTTDGQHGNELGVDEWFTMLKKVLKNCPLRD